MDRKMSTFNTKEYCISHHIPAFSFTLNDTKECSDNWKSLTPTNFAWRINDYDNGFAVITGFTHMVVDFDLKHNPPQAIYDVLNESCSAVERTPGGYHFWFLLDEHSTLYKNKTEVCWDNVVIEGLDIRTKGGICYCAPSHYVAANGSVKQYTWMRGDLSTATTMPSTVYTRMTNALDTITDTVTNKATDVDSDELLLVLNGLSPKRADSYSDWTTVGMALKNAGFTCDVWDKWSSQSPKYKSGECLKKWSSFSLHGTVTASTLYYWLKQDNRPLFMELQTRRQEITQNLLCATHASVAHAFYTMNPRAYLYTMDEGWFILQPNQTWLGTGSTDIKSIPGLLNHILDDSQAVLKNVVAQINLNNDGDQMKAKMLKQAIRSVEHTGFLRGVATLLLGKYAVHNVQFNEKRNLFAFSNGLINMMDGSFRPIEADDYITVTCGYDWREPRVVEKEMVRNFLKKMLPQDAVLEYILLALSRSLIGGNDEQLFHVLTGMGANGKSCLMDLCKLVFGDYYQTLSATYLTEESDGKDRPLPEMVTARYARMLVTSEPDVRKKLQINVLKNITGNEEVVFRGMFARNVTKYLPQFMLWILTNDMPSLSKYDQAIERRMRCVHFLVRFVYAPRAENEALRDDSLSSKFKTDEGWKFGLLGLLLDTHRQSAGARLVMPSEVKETTTAYMLENNPVGAWLHSRYDITGRREDIIQKTDFYKAFLGDTGIQKTQKAFSEDMVKCNILERKTNGERFYFGIVRKQVIDNND